MQLTNNEKVYFLAKDYIRNRAALEKYECTICYEIVPDVVRCKGPCANVICLKCVSRSGYMTRPCPHRCSTILEIEKIPNIQISFDCPFNKKKCLAQMKSEQDFKRHLNNCKYKTQAFINEQQLKKSFCCPKSHNLTFINSDNIDLISQNANSNIYQTMMNQTCSMCGQVTLCRSSCLQCSQQNQIVSFCTKCRFPPCTTSFCPLGHQLQTYENFTFLCVCDCCGTSALLYSKIAYYDKICNFVLCFKCYSRIQFLEKIEQLRESSKEEQNKQVLASSSKSL